MKLTVTERCDDFMVHPEGKPGEWDCGKTIQEAIRNWVRTHGKTYGIYSLKNHTIVKELSVFII